MACTIYSHCRSSKTVICYACTFSFRSLCHRITSRNMGCKVCRRYADSHATCFFINLKLPYNFLRLFPCVRAFEHLAPAVSAGNSFYMYKIRKHCRIHLFSRFPRFDTPISSKKVQVKERNKLSTEEIGRAHV